MPKLKPEEMESRKREIIEAACRCFLRSGFHQTTTDEICHEAAITPGGLYHHFGSKDEIIQAVIEDTARRTVERLDSVAQGSGDLRSAGREVASFILEAMRHPSMDSMTGLDVEIWAESLRNEKLAEVTRRSWALRRQWLESIVRQGVAEGLYRDKVDPKGLANLFLAISAGVRVGRLLWRDDFDADSVLGMLFLMYTGRLIRRRPAVGEVVSGG